MELLGDLDLFVIGTLYNLELNKNLMQFQI